LELSKDYKIICSLEPPIICLPNNIPISFFDSMIKKIDMSKSAKEFSFTLSVLLTDQKSDDKENIYASTKLIADMYKKSRTWSNKILSEMEESGVLKKTSYIRKGVGGRRANCFVIKIPNDFKKDMDINNEKPISVIEPIKGSKNLILSEQYISERPSTLLDMAVFIMDCLTSSSLENKPYSKLVSLDNKILECNVRALSGEYIANDSDVRILVAICSFVEDLIFQELSENKKITTSLYAPLDIEITSIVKYINGKDKKGKFKSGGGYNDVAISAMKRLSWTRIDIVEQDNKNSFLDSLLRNERYIQPLTLAIPYSTYNGSVPVQMIQFQLFPSIIKILEENVKVRMEGGIPLQIMHISNLVIQSNIEIRRVALKIYYLIGKKTEFVFFSWEELYSWKKNSMSNKKYQTELIKRIKTIGVKDKNDQSEDKEAHEEAYEIVGLKVKINQDGIWARKIHDFEYDNDIAKLIALSS